MREKKLRNHLHLPSKRRERKKTQPAAQPKPKKVTKPAQAKPALATRATTRASTQKAKEASKEKKKATKWLVEEPKKRRRYVAQPKIDDEEKIESEDINQFKVVSHPPKTAIDRLCDKIENVDLNDLKSLNFNKISREE